MKRCCGPQVAHPWFNSKSVKRLMHKETGTADFNLPGDTNTVGVPVWENETNT